MVKVLVPSPFVFFNVVLSVVLVQFCFMFWSNFPEHSSLNNQAQDCPESLFLGHFPARFIAFHPLFAQRETVLKESPRASRAAVGQNIGLTSVRVAFGPESWVWRDLSGLFHGALECVCVFFSATAVTGAEMTVAKILSNQAWHGLCVVGITCFGSCSGFLSIPL